MPPQAAAGSVATTTIGASVAAGITTSIIEAFARPTIEGGGNWLRWDVAKKIKFDHVLLEAYDSFVDAEAHPILGTSAHGIWHVIRTFVDCCVKMSVIMPHEMVDELIMEMIQEGVSNAIQTSFGGAYQTQLNVYRGGAPPYPDHVIDILFQGDKMDLKLRALNAAATGANLPSFAFYGADAIARKLAGEFDRVDTAVSSKLDEIDDAYWELVRSRVRIAQRYLEAQAEKRWMVERRVADLFEQAARRYLARLNELYSDLESIKVFVDMGLVEQETDASITVDEIKAEAEAVVRAMEELVHEVEEAKREVFGVISLDHAPLVDALETLHSEVSKIISTYYQEKFGFFELIRDIVDETFSAVRAYRYYTDESASLPEGSPEAPTDPVFLIETIEEVSVPETIKKSVVDSITFSESVQVGRTGRVHIDDAITFTDKIEKRIPDKVILLADDMTFSDEAEVALKRKGIGIYDGIWMMDEISGISVRKYALIDDEITFTDAVGAAKVWERLADLPEPARFADLVRLGDLLYHIFGKKDGGGVCAIWKYDPDTDLWTTDFEDPNFDIWYHRACQLGGYIYILGGIDISSAEYVRKLYKYDPSTRTITDTGADYVGGIVAHVMEAFEDLNLIVSAGGALEGMATDLTRRYSPATNTWSAGANAPEKFYRSGSAVISSFMYVVGGYKATDAGTVYLEDVLRYDPESDSWTISSAASPIPVDVLDPAVASYDNILYMLAEGGELWSYNFYTNTWTLRSLYPAGNVLNASAEGYEQGCVFAGGYRGGEAIQEVWRFYETGL